MRDIRISWLTGVFQQFQRWLVDWRISDVSCQLGELTIHFLPESNLWCIFTLMFCRNLDSYEVRGTRRCLSAIFLHMRVYCIWLWHFGAFDFHWRVFGE